MDMFLFFKQMQDLVDDHATVTDANMNHHDFYEDRKTMLVAGETEGEIIALEVTIMKKEVQKDAENLE